MEKPENQLTSTICSTKTKWPKDLYTFSIIGTGTWYHGTERIIRIVSRKILSFDFIFLSFNFCWFFTTRFIRAVMSQFTHNTHTVCLFFNYAFKKKSLSVGKVEMWNHTFLKECLSDTGTTQSCRDILHALSFRTSVGKEE